MGDYYLQTGDATKAEEFFNRALQQYPYASGTLVKLNELKKKRASEEKMIQAARDLDMKFVQAFNEGDLQAFMESYWKSPEVVTYPPDMIEVKGWMSMKESFTGMFENMKGTRFELTETNYLAAGDYVMGWGKFAVTFPGSPGTQPNGRYTDVKTMKDGKWVTIMDHGSFPMTMYNDPADVKKIRSLLQQEMQAGNAGDANAYLQIMSADAEIIPSGGTPVKGAATKKWMQDFFKENALHIEPYTNEELVVMGDLAYHRYNYSWKVSPKKGGKSMKEKGTGMHLFKKNANGEWQMIKDIWTPGG
jgi:ketosteroid isomerase-like protein